MKFSWKIFFVSFFIIVISFGIGGFALVNSVFTSSLNSRISSASDSNRYAASSFYAIFTDSDEVLYVDTYVNYIANNFSRQLSSSNSSSTVSIGTRDIVNTFGDESFLDGISLYERCSRTVTDGGKGYVQVVSHILIGTTDYYIQTLTDITDIYQSRDGYIRTYQVILVCVALGASLILVVISRFLTKPLVKLSNATKEIAGGNFSKRADVLGSKEIYELSGNFNSMADYVEDYIHKLEIAAQSRDDFVADFTHELKTPLTSVIGYADMLRSYELEPEKRRKCADYIYKEGKRLEALSVNLLDIIVMKNNDIALTPLKTSVLFNETGNVVEFLLKKYKMKLEINFESETVMAEQSLLKTLLYNTIDNACKASKAGQSIVLSGYVIGGAYKITVADSGRGIPSDELEKITRPFYMVDKSRSRSMGGAGLGLALCNEIAKLHGSGLEIESELGRGTKVSFTVSLYK